MELKKGDIVRHEGVRDGHTFRYMMYLKKGMFRQGRSSSKTYVFVTCDGRTEHFVRDDEYFTKIGHMDEFDAFMTALKRLREIECEEKESQTHWQH